MKPVTLHLWTFVILCVLVFPTEIVAQRFNKVLLSGSTDEISFIDRINDSTYLTVNAMNNGFRVDTINRYGNVIQGATYLRTLSSVIHLTGTKSISNGARLIYGYQTNTASNANDYNAVVQKLDSSGNLSWTSVIEDAFFNSGFISDVHEATNGFIYAAGTSIPTTYSYDAMMLAKFSPNGNLVFCQNVIPQATWDHANDVMRLFNSGDSLFYMVGSFLTQPSAKFAIVVTCMDSSGNHRWTRFVTNNEGLIMTDAKVIDGRIIATGNTSIGPNGSKDAFILSMNFDAEVDFIKIYGTERDETPKSLFTSSSGEILLVGFLKRSLGSSSDYLTICLDSNFNLISAVVDVTGNNGARNMLTCGIELADGDLVMAGINIPSSSGTRYPVLKKTDRHGRGTCTDSILDLDVKFYNGVTKFCSAQILPLSSGTAFSMNRNNIIVPSGNFGCIDTCKLNLNAVANKTRFCSGDTINLVLLDSMSFDTIHWYINNLYTATGGSLNYSTSGGGRIDVKCIAQSGVCIDSIVKFLFVDAPPIAAFTASRQYHQFEFQNLAAPEDTISFFFSSGFQSLYDRFLYAHRDTSDFSVQQIASNACGRDTSIRSYSVHDTTGVSYIRAYKAWSAWPLSAITTRAFTLCADGGMVCAGMQDNNRTLVKTNIIGDIEWATQHNNTATAGFTAVFETQELGLLLGSNTSTESHIFKVDSAGRTCWARGNGISGSSVSCVKEISDRSIIAAGSANSTSIYVMYMNEWGTVLWQKRYSTMKTVREILCVPDGFIIVGATGGDASWMKINFAGQIVRIYTVMHTGVEFFTSANILPSGRMLLVGETTSGVIGTRDILLICCDTTGNTFWQYEYGNPFSDSPECASLYNDQLYVTFGSQVPAESQTAVIDTNGNIISVHNHNWFLEKPYYLKSQVDYEGRLILMSQGTVSPDDWFVVQKNWIQADTLCNTTRSLTRDTVSLTVNIAVTGSSVNSAGTGFIIDPIVVCNYSDSIYCYSDLCSINAGFNYSDNWGTVSFTNLTYGNIGVNYWDFGDGNFSSQSNPTHMYATPGVYNVCLIASNSCRSDTICQSVNIIVTSTPSSESATETVFPNPANQTITIKFDQLYTGQIFLYDLTGKILSQKKASASLQEEFDVSVLANGVYYIKYVREQGNISTQRVVITH